MDGDVLTIDVQKSGGEEAEEDQDGVKCACCHVALSILCQSHGMTDALLRAD